MIPEHAAILDCSSVTDSVSRHNQCACALTASGCGEMYFRHSSERRAGADGIFVNVRSLRHGDWKVLFYWIEAGNGLV